MIEVIKSYLAKLGKTGTERNLKISRFLTPEYSKKLETIINKITNKPFSNTETELEEEFQKLKLEKIELDQIYQKLSISESQSVTPKTQE